MGGNPLAGLLRKFFDGRVFFSESTAAEPAEVAATICPPQFRQPEFLSALKPLYYEAKRACGLITKPLRIGNFECDVRIMVAADAVLATCSDIRPRRRSEDNQPLDSLSDREFEVLELLTAGLANKQVAAKLYLSHRTVEKHRARIHQKTGTRSLALLTRLWIDAGYDEVVSTTNFQQAEGDTEPSLPK